MSNGVKCLNDIRDRCRIDQETGCWVWAMASVAPKGSLVPVVYVSGEVLSLGLRPNNTPAAKAAWLMSGRKLEKGEVVYRYTCTNKLCVNPAHCRAGTRKQMGKDISETGRNKGKPERRAICQRNRANWITSPEKVREVEAIFASGATTVAAAAQAGIDKLTARRIRCGLHPHSSSAAHKVIQGASAFTWRP